MICPYCEQGEILKAKVKKTGEIIYICDECDSVWKQKIIDDNATNFYDYAEENNIQITGDDLEIIEKHYITDNNELRNMNLFDSVQDVIIKHKLNEYVNGYINFNVLVDKIDKKQDLQKAFSNYVIEHDDYRKGEWNFVLEEIQHWDKELQYIYSSCDNETLKVDALIDLLRSHNVRAYKLTHAGPREGSPIEMVDKGKEIVYVEDGVTGWIRCYESEEERLIIKWIGND